MDDLISLFKEKKAIILSSFALGIIAFFNFKLFIFCFFAHVIFCGYLGYQEATREFEEIKENLKKND